MPPQGYSLRIRSAAPVIVEMPPQGYSLRIRSAAPVIVEMPRKGISLVDSEPIMKMPPQGHGVCYFLLKRGPKVSRNCENAPQGHGVSYGRRAGVTGCVTGRVSIKSLSNFMG
jgi:hypothetical protein